MERDKPVCFLYHSDHGWVPATVVANDYITWDDGQWSRDMEPCPSYEVDSVDEFDLSRGRYVFEQA